MQNRRNKTAVKLLKEANSIDERLDICQLSNLSALSKVVDIDIEILIIVLPLKGCFFFTIGGCSLLFERIFCGSQKTLRQMIKKEPTSKFAYYKPTIDNMFLELNV